MSSQSILYGKGGEVITVDQDASIEHVAELMREHCGVARDQRRGGVVTGLVLFGTTVRCLSAGNICTQCRALCCCTLPFLLATG